MVSRTVSFPVWNGPRLPAIIDRHLYFEVDEGVAHESRTVADYDTLWTEAEYSLAELHERGIGCGYMCPDFEMLELNTPLLKVYNVCTDRECDCTAPPKSYYIARVPLDLHPTPCRLEDE